MKLIDKILNEALELNTENVYNLSGRASMAHGYVEFFFDENHEEIKITYEQIPPYYLKNKVSNLSSNAIGYNLSFFVNGSPYQSFKSSYSHYIKILSTVFKSALNLINEEQPDFLLVGAAKGLDSLGEQKGKIYNQIFTKNSSKIPSNYTFTKVTVEHIEGYLIQKVK